MSDLVKEKPVMEEVQIRYNNFIKDRLMMNEYDKREAYLYGNQIMLEEERRLGIEQGEKMKAISMAKNMKNRNMDINLISELTGLEEQKYGYKSHKRINRPEHRRNKKLVNAIRNILLYEQFFVTISKKSLIKIRKIKVLYVNKLI